MQRLLFAVLGVLLLAVGANAQTFRGAIDGTVADPSGAVIPQARFGGGHGDGDRAHHGDHK